MSSMFANQSKHHLSTKSITTEIPQLSCEESFEQTGLHKNWLTHFISGHIHPCLEVQYHVGMVWVQNGVLYIHVRYIRAAPS